MRRQEWVNHVIETWMLLLVLEHIGYVEKGFVDAALQRGATFVRKPGVKKGSVGDPL